LEYGSYITDEGGDTVSYVYACDRCGYQYRSMEEEEVKCPNCGASYFFDFCFDCGIGLSYDMEENKDWFEVRGNAEAYPVCAKCYEESGGANFRESEEVIE
jgi:DNA-directed RNA polymerase subunit RPC12/RpoP